MGRFWLQEIHWVLKPTEMILENTCAQQRMDLMLLSMQALLSMFSVSTVPEGVLYSVTSEENNRICPVPKYNSFQKDNFIAFCNSYYYCPVPQPMTAMMHKDDSVYFLQSYTENWGGKHPPWLKGLDGVARILVTSWIYRDFSSIRYNFKLSQLSKNVQS